jgi:hypothetical protein
MSTCEAHVSSPLVISLGIVIERTLTLYQAYILSESDTPARYKGLLTLFNYHKTMARNISKYY